MSLDVRNKEEPTRAACGQGHTKDMATECLSFLRRFCHLEGGPGPSLPVRSASVACSERQIRFVACPRCMRCGQPRMDLLEGWISVSRI
ncbi:BQ5605_C015g07975 [Microbotryum silenes-dioicae]|uniref:BQ5605_C015g07975 protein n=1 Tax=Microbotryum silenes-dioicae TaxID=796604 RepID=A0A2X0NWT8_9BASI|nr:BQ5605_C015g07975 [Microbotryum silenes-dioicae]